MLVRSAVVSRASQVVTLAAALGAAVVLAGCGTATSPSATQAKQSPVPTVAATHAPAPECSAVWVEGHKLPRAYPGCLLGGHLIAAQRHSCSSGQVLVTYSSAFYAVTGGPVNRVPGLAHTKLYKKMMRACNG